MTLIDLQLLKNISVVELLHKNFTKPDLSPNFVEMVETFNKVKKRTNQHLSSICAKY